MEFQITGANRETGKDESIIVDAPSEAEAVKSAGAKVFIEKVKHLPPREGTPALDYANPKTANKPIPSPPPIAMQEELRFKVPVYWGNLICGTILALIGMVILFAGAAFASTRVTGLDSPGEELEKRLDFTGFKCVVVAFFIFIICALSEITRLMRRSEYLAKFQLHLKIEEIKQRESAAK